MKPLCVLRIAAQSVPVVVQEDLKDHHGFYESLPRPLITVAKQDPFQTATTILHEVIHVISEFYGLGFPERTVRVLEVALTTLCRDNPEEATLFLKALERDSWSQEPEKEDYDDGSPRGESEACVPTEGDPGGTGCNPRGPFQYPGIAE